MQATVVLGDRYELGSEVGSGGMARVYLATDLTLGRPVAVKVLAEPYDRDRAFVELFRGEAQAAARLNHPNIVSVYDSGDDDGRPFIVMEFVEGETLGERLRREGPLAPPEAARIAADVARALGAAHQGGVVHRDVKPGNVMMARDGTVKVVDFGIARASGAEAVTRSGLVLGSASYLSPEQARGESGDPRSDLYALGCVLYQMLTGRPPFVADDPVAALYQHVNELPMAPSAFRPVPRELEDVVLCALEKDPSRRFRSAEQMEEALRGIAEGEEPTATMPIAPVAETAPIARVDPTPPSTSARRPAPGWGRPALAVVALLAVAFLAILAFDRTDLASRADRRENRPAVTDESIDTAEPPSVGDAYRALVETITVVQTTADIDPVATGNLIDRAGAIFEKYRSGDLEAVEGEIQTFREDLAKMTDEGVIPLEEADRIESALDTLDQAISEDPPVLEDPVVEEPPSEDDGKDEGDEEQGGGPPPWAGGGNGNGNGHGNDK